ncbi:MAG: MFS transporter [Nitrospirota bacterium]|nr:MFS transporter [Nitrospirota bacterium]
MERPPSGRTQGDPHRVSALGAAHNRSRPRWLLTRDFALVWWGQLISQIGDGVSKLALLWFVYSITGSPLKTMVIGLLQTIPPIAFGPLIGVYVDRLPKKPLLIGTDVVRALLIGLIPCWVSVETFTVERLYVLVFLHAVATAVFGPALTASVPLIVQRTQFTAANALLQSTTSLGVIVGPALSGLGIAALSSQDVLCVNAVTYLFSAACLLPVRLAPVVPPRADGAPTTTAIRDLLAGLRFALIEQRIVLLLTATAAFYTFGTSAFTTLFPVFGRKMLDLGPVEVGYLWSAFGIGLLLTSLGLVWVTEWSLSQRVRLIAVSSAISGAALWGLVWASDHLVAGLLMAVAGSGVGALTPIAWGVLQEIAPPQMVGRVLALYTTGAMTAAIAGMTFFGWTTQEFGERPSVIGIGAILFITAIAAIAFGRWVQAHRPSSALGDPAASRTRLEACGP